MADFEGNQIEEEWVPPTEGELKIIEAHRERQDKISKIMGQYLLKGYRMLSTTCPQCSNILMRTRPANGTVENGVDFCIACNELDSDISKDDPVLDMTAARSQVLEGQARDFMEDKAMVCAMEDESPGTRTMRRMTSGDGSVPVDDSTEAQSTNPEGAVSSATSMRMGRPDTGATQIESCTALGCLRKCDPPRVSSDEVGSRARCAMMVICPSAKVKDQTPNQGTEQLAGQQDSTSLPASTSSYNHHYQNGVCHVHHRARYPNAISREPQHLSSMHHFQNIESQRIRDSLAAVLDKMAWASDQLKKSKEVEQSRQFCGLISCCAEAISALKAASSFPLEKSEDRQ